MKKPLIYFTLCLSFFAAQAQETVTLSMEPGYSQRVFFNLEDQVINSYLNADWDVAFYRISNFEFATRINDGKGIEAYEAASDPSQWASIDPANNSSWVPLYNSDTEWTIGAFDNGSATYGWGEYNSATHHVEGIIIFALAFADGGYAKFMIEDFFGGYTIKYAHWNGTSWDADETHTISNSSNPQHLFNYFSLQNGQEVIAEPESDQWDLVFTKYITNLGGGMMYPVTGVLHHPELLVAKHDETSGAPVLDDLVFEEAINTIGYDWKSFNGSVFEVDSDTGYYIKTPGGTVYKIIFTVFEGSSTGIVSFDLENMGTLHTSEVQAPLQLALYPNPATGNQVTINLSNQQLTTDTSISVFSLNGQKLWETQLNAGEFQREISLNGFHSGVYVVMVSNAIQQVTKKLIIK